MKVTIYNRSIEGLINDMMNHPLYRPFIAARYLIEGLRFYPFA